MPQDGATVRPILTPTESASRPDEEPEYVAGTGPVVLRHPWKDPDRLDPAVFHGTSSNWAKMLDGGTVSPLTSQGQPRTDAGAESVVRARSGGLR